MKTRKTEHLKTVFPQEFYCELAFLGEAKRQGAWTTGKTEGEYASWPEGYLHLALPLSAVKSMEALPFSNFCRLKPTSKVQTLSQNQLQIDMRSLTQAPVLGAHANWAIMPRALPQALSLSGCSLHDPLSPWLWFCLLAFSLERQKEQKTFVSHNHSEFRLVHTGHNMFWEHFASLRSATPTPPAQAPAPLHSELVLTSTPAPSPTVRTAVAHSKNTNMNNDKNKEQG